MSRGPSLTSFLYSVLPNANTAVVILRNSKLFKSPLQIKQRPQPANIDLEGLNGDLVLTSSTHPVLFSQKLIQLPICLQHLDSKDSEPLEIQLNESVTSAARRYSDTACGYVLLHDELISSLDRLQTLMLQGPYYITIGDFRKAWSIHRWVSSIASAMGIPMLAQTMGGCADSVWFRPVYSDRFLSRILDSLLQLPKIIWEEQTAETQSHQLKSWSEFMSWLQGGARNMRMQNRDLSYERAWSYNHELLETKNIDQELKRATRLLPSSWWLAPSLSNATMESEVLDSTGRRLAQMHKHYLRVLLHQPHLIQQLCSNSDDEELQKSAEATYSTLAATSASREMISHYLEFR